MQYTRRYSGTYSASCCFRFFSLEELFAVSCENDAHYQFQVYWRRRNINLKWDFSIAWQFAGLVLLLVRSSLFFPSKRTRFLPESNSSKLFIIWEDYGYVFACPISIRTTIKVAAICRMRKNTNVCFAFAHSQSNTGCFTSWRNWKCTHSYIFKVSVVI